MANNIKVNKQMIIPRWVCLKKKKADSKKYTEEFTS